VLIAQQRNPVLSRLAPVSDFPELPPGIAQDLTNRGCRIPQIKEVRGRHNVLREWSGAVAVAWLVKTATSLEGYTQDTLRPQANW